jgi:hypothetical protein
MNSATFESQASGGCLRARLTPWDQRALGFITAEVTHFRADATQAPILLEELEEWARGQQVHYLFGRIDAGDLVGRAALSVHGHEVVECSFTLSRSGFSGLPQLPARQRPLLRPATADDLSALQMIARDDFHHGRFLEDPAIDRDLARSRTMNWVGDLFEQGLLYAAELQGRLIGFHAERISPDGRHADLLLTGAGSRYSMLAMPLWICVLDRLGERGVQDCSTVVSAANTGIVNLYARLGFRFDACLFGFRKFYVRQT